MGAPQPLPMHATEEPETLPKQSTASEEEDDGEAGGSGGEAPNKFSIEASRNQVCEMTVCTCVCIIVSI